MDRSRVNGLFLKLSWSQFKLDCYNCMILTVIAMATINTKKITITFREKNEEEIKMVH